MSETALTPVDLALLAQLQRNPRISMAELAEKTNSSVSPCWRRVKRLEESKIIEGYGISLNRKALGFGIEAFVFVKIASHSEEQAVQFETALKPVRNILSCHILSGQDDYLLRVVARDIDDFAEFGRKVLAALPHVREVRSAFVLHTIKSSSELPFDIPGAEGH
ncbi:Lrp/AsnC family transcriptional regulator [Variovorax sp. M-6]|uniref:Lrp/AsnC family transcriptional regulator n=1 Tax=Variovorax sp. M-6 TaxID=3233041 RepID=UPI003F947971